MALMVLRLLAVFAFSGFSDASEGVTMMVGEAGAAPDLVPLALDVRVETLSR